MRREAWLYKFWPPAYDLSPMIIIEQYRSVQ